MEKYKLLPYGISDYAQVKREGKYIVFDTLLTFCFLLTFITSCGDKDGKDSATVPDSIYTKAYINHICRTQPQRALCILDTAEMKALMKPADINGMRAMIYHNGYHLNQIAVNYAKRAYHDNKGSGDTLTTFNILKMLTALSYDSKSYSEALEYADAGLQFARKVKDIEAEAYFMQFCGFTKAEIGSVDEAIGYLDRSIYLYKEVASKDPDWKNLHDLFYPLLFKQKLLIDHNRCQEAISVDSDTQDALRNLEQCKELPEGLADKSRAELYTQQARLHFLLGDTALAEKKFTLFKQTEWANTPESFETIASYLNLTNRHDEILKHAESMKERERQSNYQMDMKDRQLLEHELTIARQNTRNLLLGGLALVLFVICAIATYYTRIIRRKNATLAATISELTAAKRSSTSLKIKTRNAETSQKNTNVDQELFERIEKYIYNNKPYLQPGFGREGLLEAFPNTNRTQLASLFSTYAGCSITQYLNALRLAHSITLLESNTPMSIEGIAQECGYSNRQTFHRLFVEKYGLSPAEYRKNIGHCPNTPNKVLNFLE